VRVNDSSWGARARVRLMVTGSDLPGNGLRVSMWVMIRVRVRVWDRFESGLEMWF
jgi:hypothetical protein